MVAGRRVQRVESEIRQLVGSFLISGLKIPLRGLVTVAEIEVTSDLRLAKVFLSYMGSDEDRESDIEALEEQRSSVQRFVSKKLNLKFTPILKFFFNKAPMSDVDLMIAKLRQNK